MIYTILETIAASLFLICLGFIAYWIFRWVQGDCEFRVVTRRQSRAVAESLSHTQAVLSFTAVSYTHLDVYKRQVYDQL